MVRRSKAFSRYNSLTDRLLLSSTIWILLFLSFIVPEVRPRDEIEHVSDSAVHRSSGSRKVVIDTLQKDGKYTEALSIAIPSFGD